MMKEVMKDRYVSIIVGLNSDEAYKLNVHCLLNNIEYRIILFSTPGHTSELQYIMKKSDAPLDWGLRIIDYDTTKEDLIKTLKEMKL
jgi:hypothetical protein